MFKIVIPSYKRSKIIFEKTITKIIFEHNLNINNEVYIFVIKDEYDDYKYLEQYKNFKVIIGVANLDKQRNYIKDYFNENEKLFILDDDLLKIITFDNTLINEINLTFDYMKKHNIYLCGVNPTNNFYFNNCCLKKGFYFCVGCCYFEINNKHKLLYLDDYNLQSEKEDYIRSINHFKYNGLVARNDSITIQHKFNYTSGGMNNENRKNNNIKAIKYLYDIYPNFLKLQNKKDGQELKIYNKIFYIKYFKKLQDTILANYYNDNNYYKLDIKKNYLIYDFESKKLMSIVLRNVLNTDLLNEKLIYKIDKWCNKYNDNRGDIAGILDYDKLSNYNKETYLKNKNNISNTGSRCLIKNGFQFSNKLNCITLGYYTKNKLSFYDNKHQEFIQNNFIYLVEQLNNIYKNIYLDKFETTIPNKKYLNSYFSSITINKGLRSANHKDKNNKSYYALLLVLENKQEGNFSGCDLLFPDYKLNLNVQKNKDIVIFDSKNINHCNSEFINNSNITSRLSFVFFSK